MRVLLVLLFLVHCSLGNTADRHDSVARAVKWLESQRDHEFGWGITTASCVTALQLANNSWLHEDRLDNMLTVKQLEVDMLVKFFNDFFREPVVVSGLSGNATKEETYAATQYLYSHREKVLSPGKVAQFVLTLLSLCRNPRNFHGKDLVGVLQRMEPEHDFEIALHTLAICLSDGHVRKRNARKVLEITQKELDDRSVGGIDTHSMGIIALQCLTNSHKHRPISTYLNSQVKALVQSQNQDGSFGNSQNPDGSYGNVYSTGLAVQALSLYNESMGWDPTASLLWLRSQQKIDGSFLGYVDATVTVLPALAGRGFRDLKDYACNFDRKVHFEEGQLLAAAPVTESIPSNDVVHTISVSYTLWFDQNVSKIHSLNMTVPANSSFYQIMQIAAEQDRTFEFSASIWPNGHYIHTIGGFHERPTRAEGFHFWLLYKLPRKPDPNNKPPNSAILPVGVDDYFPEDGDFILFWFKQI